jgi:hypothetical protein
VLLIAVTFKVPLPILVMVSGNVLVEPIVVVGKVKENGEILDAGPATAVPVRSTYCGAPVALSVMVKLPPYAPVTLGVNIT